MSGVDELAVTAAARDLLHRYAHACDDRLIDEFVDLFTEDAVFVVAGHRFDGRAGARQWMESAAQNPAGTHVTINEVVTVESPTRATCIAAFVFFRREGGTGPWEIFNVGRYHDVMVDDGGAWRLAAREITLH